MKVTVPSKSITVCDICKRESGLLTKCLICGSEYCTMCDAYLPGCMIEAHICRPCDDRLDVQDVIKRYSNDFVKIYKLRDKALARLSRKTSRTDARADKVT